jgi:hypothetical protein
VLCLHQSFPGNGFNTGVSSASALTSFPLGSQRHRLSLLFTDSLTTLNSCSNCPPYNIWATDRVENTVHFCTSIFPWEHVCLRRRYSETAAYSCLLRICCLAADVVWLSVSRSLPSNGSLCYNTFLVHIVASTSTCARSRGSLLHIIIIKTSKKFMRCMHFVGLQVLKAVTEEQPSRL